MLIPIRNVGQIGVVQDTPAHMLPANVWSDARGVRFYDNAVWKAFGYNAEMGTPSGAPYYIHHFTGASNNYWAYPGLANIWATDGSTHADISRIAGGAYAGTADDIWQGTHLAGIVVLNNGIDIPQAWIDPSLGTPCVDLTNWPAVTTARTIKAFKQYLIAMDVTQAGTQFPYLVKWSHVADPGNLPSSWDPTIPTNDAGEYPLAETGGHILDGLALQDQFMIYKEDETWSMSYIGGRFIFQFKKRFNTGIVQPRCVVAYKAKHYVATSEDVIVHDGFQQESLLDDRMRRWYKGQADPEFARRQFMVLNAVENEIWVCIPGAGQEHPNVALIINFKDGTQTLRDLPNPTYIATGPYDSAAGNTTFDSQTIPFDQVAGVFGQRSSKPGTDRLMGAHRLGGSRFLMYEEGFQQENSDFRGYVERQSMPVSGLSRDGGVQMDTSSVKQVNEVWVEARIANGTTLNVYVGGQDTLNEGISWEGPLPFVVGVDDKVDCCTTGRYISVRFETTDGSRWKLDSYALNLEVLGRY